MMILHAYRGSKVSSLRLAAAALAAGCLAGASHAALVEDFNGLSDGAVNGQNGWAADSDQFNVVSSAPFSATDKALSNAGVASGTAYKSFGSIADGAVGTVFFQMYLTNLSAGTSFGLADTSVDDTSPFESYRSQLALTSGGAFTVRNGGASATLDQAISTDTLYNIWIVSDNASNTSQFYIQGGAYATQTQLTSGGGATASFAYRNQEPDTAELTNFLFATGTSIDDAAYIDNIYFSAGIDLNNPIPEPASLALFGLGALLCLPRPRRQG